MPLLNLRHRNPNACVLTRKQIHQILNRVDENLQQNPLYRDPAVLASGALDDVLEQSQILSELHRYLRELYSMQAPFFVVKGRDFSNQLKRILNLPLRTFGSKQAHFNNELLRAIEMIVAQMHTISHLTDSVEDLRQTIALLEVRSKMQEAIILDLQERLDNVLDRPANVSLDQREEHPS